jgi:hypothetical protein
VLRVVAVAVLALGIVLMHHVARPDHDTSAGQALSIGSHAATTSVDGQAPAAASNQAPLAGHEMLHLCLAVLMSAVILLVGRLYGLRPRSPWLVPLVRHHVLGPARSRPPPRPYGTALFVSLCVMRT